MKINKHNKAFGHVLRALRKERKLTQETLGFEAELDRTYVSLLELGESSPTLDTLVVLCKPLGLSLTELCQKIETEILNHE